MDRHGVPHTVVLRAGRVKNTHTHTHERVRNSQPPAAAVAGEHVKTPAKHLFRERKTRRKERENYEKLYWPLYGETKQEEKK